MRKIHITSLGCPKNLVDTEVMIGTLEKAGWQVCETVGEADVFLVNTCGFIQPAVEEGIEEILQLAAVKEKKEGSKLVITGCMVQRYSDNLLSEIPEIDLLVGTEGVVDIAKKLQQLIEGGQSGYLHMPDEFLMDSTVPRTLTTPYYQAWMKITEGCDNRCSYCMIPSIRGRLRSRAIDDLVLEAQLLERKGVKELILIAQDLTAYGRDGDEKKAELIPLVENLLHKTSIPWLRLLYLYPSGITTELFQLMAANERIVPYLDIPFQHVSSSVLRAMNRRYDRELLVELIEQARGFIPDIALRTTFLLGFPGESEDDVEQLESFLRTMRLDHVGVFAYSNEEGCPAEFYPDQVDTVETQRRVDHILSVQAEISEDIQRKYIGRVEPVIVEGVSRETELLLEGRTRFQAPDIDGCVYINDGQASVGDIVQVEISESQVYDLVGGIVENPA